MIQAITQTMIGEFLWKYTRKTGRSEMSETRHRRFFWVHPYTRTLYWSEQDPATAGRAQLKAKSVAIEAVRVVTDDNAFPPGLHRKSLVVVTPGRSIKFTAPTGQRHETWFNALSYLLLRTANEREEEDEGQVTAEDIEEFNPGAGSSYGRNFSRLSRRSKVSLSSYNSRGTRATNPNRDDPHLIPTLAQRQSAAKQKAEKRELQAAAQQGSVSRGSISGRFSSLSGAFKNNGAFRGSFSSRHSRQALNDYEDATTPSGRASGPPVGGDLHDSAEDLRQVIERQERESDRLENVRACCDGKC